MRVLLVSPVFHDYWTSVVRGFESLGHESACIRYDDLDGPAAKVANKLRLEIPERLGRDRTAAARRWATARVGSQLSAHRPDVVVVVKGDLLDPGLWEPLQRRHVPVVLWLYDELRRTRHDRGTLGAYRAVATYSPEDRDALGAQGVVAAVVPLAFDPVLSRGGPAGGTEVLFVGARYPARAAILTELVGRGIPVRAYGRDWSHRPFDRLRTLDWTRAPVPGAPDVSREEAAGLMRRSVAALNVHGDQDGFNIRTFEACGVGAVQLIDRPEVKDFYDPGEELLVFGGIDDLVAQVERVQSDRVWADRLREAGRRRTLAEHTFDRRCADLLALC